MAEREAGAAAAVRVVTLGTAGGPQWWRGGADGIPAGISTAVVVGDDVYLVDAGYGTGGQLARAGLRLSQVRAVFLTHLHSDHVVDLPGLMLFGTYELRGNPHLPIPVVGPGDRGALPPVSEHARVAPDPVHPDQPTPGVAGLLDGISRAFATDVNDRVLDGLRTPPLGSFRAEEISIPASAGFHPNDSPSPDMAPFQVYSDELVRVSATLVQHPPVAPAFAFRFDIAGSSVIISGDTAPSENLVRLAAGGDLLLHEAIDEQWLRDVYGDADLDPVARAGIAHHRRAHTTPAEAGSIAARAGVARLGLHHLVPGGLEPERWRRAAAAAFTGDILVPSDLEEIAL